MIASSETQGQIKGARESLNGVFFWHQSEARTAATVGTGLVRHCPQWLFSPFFTFLRVIFFHPFRLSLVPTICPWVSEDVVIVTERRTDQPSVRSRLLGGDCKRLLLGVASCYSDCIATVFSFLEAVSLTYSFCKPDKKT